MTAVIKIFLTGIIIVVLFLLIHAFKLMRMYLVLIDGRIEFKRFVFAYFRTTLINLIIPFKLGEVYRVFVFYRLTGDFATGFLSVIVDRFFDTLALVFVMLPFQILYPDTLSFVSVMLAVFLAVIVFAYMIFPPTYRYLNKYIILNRVSPRSMAVLKLLNGLKVWYEYVKSLIAGRYALLLLMSFGAWFFEGILFRLLSVFYPSSSFDARGFCEYITSLLSSVPKTMEQRAYVRMCVILTLILTVISAVICLSKKGSAKAFAYKNKEDAYPAGMRLEALGKRKRK